MDIKCTAKVDEVDAKEDTAIVRLRTMPDHTLSQERHIYNAGNLFLFLNNSEKTLSIYLGGHPVIQKIHTKLWDPKIIVHIICRITRNLKLNSYSTIFSYLIVLVTTIFSIVLHFQCIFLHVYIFYWIGIWKAIKYSWCLIIKVFLSHIRVFVNKIAFNSPFASSHAYIIFQNVANSDVTWEQPCHERIIRYTRFSSL